MSDPSKADPRSVSDAINLANPEIDKQSGPPGAQVKATRAVLDAMNDAANTAIEKQQSSGSGHS